MAAGLISSSIDARIDQITEDLHNHTDMAPSVEIDKMRLIARLDEMEQFKEHVHEQFELGDTKL